MKNIIIFGVLKFWYLRDTKYQVVDLSTQGLTMIVGPNGAGKTTIADALCILFFGQSVRGESLKDVRPSKLPNVTTELNLDFRYNETSYEIYMQIPKSGTPVYRIFENDIQVAGKVLKSETRAHRIRYDSVNSIKAFLRQFIPHQLFFNSIFFSARSDNSFFVNLTPTAKKKFLEAFIPGIAEFQRAEILVKDRLKLLQAEMETTSFELSRYDEFVKEERAAAEATRTRLLESKVKLESRIAKTRQEIEQAQLWLKTAALQEDPISKLRQEITRLSEAQQRCADLGAASNKELEACEAEFARKYQAQRAQYTTRIQALNAERSTREEDLQAQLQALRKKEDADTQELRQQHVRLNQQLYAEISKVTLAIGKSSADLASLQKTKTSLSAEIKQLERSKSATGKCPTCGRTGPTDILLDTLAKKMAELEGLESTYTQNAQAHQASQESDRQLKLLQQQQLDSQALELGKLTTTASEASTKLQDALKRIQQAFDSELQLLQKNLEILSAAEAESRATYKPRLELMKKCQQCDVEHRDYFSKRSEKQQELSQLDAQYGTLRQKAVQQQKLEAEERLRETTTDLQVAVDDLQVLDKNVDERIKSRKGSLDETAKQLRIKQQVFSILGKAFSHKGIRVQYLADLIPTMNRFLAIRGAQITPNFQTRLVRDEDQVHFESKNLIKGSGLKSFSRGEEALISLTTLLALADLLQSYANFDSNLLIFDEIFDSLDVANSALVFESLHALSQIKRVLLITHNEHYKSTDASDVLINFFDQ